MDPSPANWRNLNSQTSESMPVPFPAFKLSLLRGRVSTKRNPKVAALSAGVTVGISDAFAKLKKERRKALKVLDSCGSDIIEEAASQSLARGTTFDSVISTLKQHPSDIPSKQPQAVLDRRICNKISEVHIHWQDTSPAEASWEKVDFIKQQFLPSHLRTSVILRGVMLPTPLHTRRHTEDSLTGSSSYPKKFSLRYAANMVISKQSSYCMAVAAFLKE